MIILIVDDNKGMRECLKRELQDGRGQHCIVLAENGREAWTFVQRLSPDLVIADINMPVMDGIELLKRIKAACPEVPVVLISSEPPISEAKARELGAEALVNKEVIEIRIPELMKKYAV